MSSISSDFSRTAPHLKAVEDHLKNLRSLYHKIEAAPSVHKIEQEIYGRLKGISQEINSWKIDQVIGDNEEFQDKMGRLRKIFYQVQDQLHLKLASPFLPKTEFPQYILEELDDQLIFARNLYHTIQKAESIEEIAQEMQEKIDRISLWIKDLAEKLPRKQVEDFDDKMSRLKVTLYEVKECLKETMGMSLFNAVSSLSVLIRKMKISKLRSSHSQIREKIEHFRKHAEILDRRNFYVNRAIIILDANNCYIDELQRLNH